ncbi:MAG: hypothetical protein RR595_11430 [Lysinibacillus sp.]
MKGRPRQMIRVLDTGEKSIFNHPEIQLEEYVFGLQQFFELHNVSAKVNGVVIFPFNNANVNYEDGKFPILMMRELSTFLRQHISMSKDQPLFHSEEIVHLLLRHHQPFTRFSLCNYYKLDLNVINTGVFCPKCHRLSMQRVKYSWFCPACQHYSNTAHIQALNDYRMLICHQISNREAQRFLHTPDRHVIKRILQRSANQIKGKTNKSVFYLSGD